MKPLLILITSLMLFAACKKDKGYSLVGKWKNIATGNGMDGWLPLVSQNILTLNSDNTFTFEPPPLTSVSACTSTYRVSENKLMLTMCPAGSGAEVAYSFSVGKNTLTLVHLASSIQLNYVRL